MTPPRILEIGSYGLFHSAFPAQTTLVRVDPLSELQLDLPRDFPGWPRLLALRRAVRRGDFDLVAVHVQRHRLRRAVAWPLPDAAWRFLRRALTRPSTFAPRLALAAPPATGVVFLDLSDCPVIGPQNFPLLARAALAFKRELPPNLWNAFLYTTPKNQDPLNIGRQPRFAALAQKLRPLSLGVANALARRDFPPAEKRHDIFFAGRLDRSPLRPSGLAELQALRARGVRVHLPETPLSHDAFLEACAASWLTWSPEGGGWECFRHYEAALAGSVPLINAPAILRHRPLVHGEHCLLYPPEPGGLAATVARFLPDKPALARIAAAARAHVLAHHTHSQLARHILAEWETLRAAQA